MGSAASCGGEGDFVRKSFVSDPGYEREPTEVERKRLFEHIKKLVPWENTCRYLYLPRLQSRDVLRWTIEAGTDTKDYFRFESAEFEGE